MTGDAREQLPLWLGAKTRRFLVTRLAEVPVEADESELPAPSREEQLSRELAELFRRTERQSPDDRTAALMEWILNQTDAARCALIPFDGGVSRPPIAFQLRGKSPGPWNPRHVPRRIISQAARSRQPLISHDVGEQEQGGSELDTVARQRVQSFMAVPVVFHGELLAVCYVDRFVEPPRFSDEEQAVFEAFAYELARPLLVLRDERRRKEYRELRDSLLDKSSRAPGLVRSPALEPVLERAQRLAPHVDENLLILGETGVGKEVVARFIHEHSGRGKGPFVAFNVSAVSPDLFESELFGSVRGAFTGAVDRGGRVAAAEGGGNISETARAVECPKSTLMSLIKKHDLRPAADPA